MHEPDATGHRHGPEGEETMKNITYLDSLVGVFCRKINQLEHAGQINLIFTSDHGMGAISPERTITLTDHVPAEWAEVALGGNPVFNIKAKEGFIDSIYLKLKNVNNISVWKHSEVPAELNYGRNPRTLDLIVAADSAWSINWTPRPDYYNSGGTHGYDFRQLDMQAIFYATGPSFRKGYVHPKFDNVDLYPLIAQILGLVPKKVDGKLEHTKGMLRK
jgi:predicted AlkP superfamily pyrophosphatase or phosphodiesterase